jgi:subtilisin family serine protease
MGKIYLGLVVSLLALVPVAVPAKGRPLRVAILDTGANTFTGAKMCASGHAEFVGSGSTADRHGHGSNIAALIAQEAGDANYCLIIVKIFGGPNEKDAYIRGLHYTIGLKPDIVNLSWGGYRYDIREAILIKELLSNGVRIHAAAGNNNLNFNEVGCKFMPACLDPRIFIVANVGATANYGNRYIDVTIDGRHKLGAGLSMGGSSQSTALYTGQVVRAKAGK